MNWFQRWINGGAMISGNSDAHKMLEELEILKRENARQIELLQEFSARETELYDIIEKERNLKQSQLRRCEELENAAKADRSLMQELADRAFNQKSAYEMLDKSNTKTVMKCVELERELTRYREIIHLLKPFFIASPKCDRREFPPTP